MSEMKNQLMVIVEGVDDVFGDGYSKKNPELVGRLAQAKAHLMSSFHLSEAIRLNAEIQHLAGTTNAFSN